MSALLSQFTFAAYISEDVIGKAIKLAFEGLIYISKKYCI
jgi:hypothetical protein